MPALKKIVSFCLVILFFIEINGQELAPKKMRFEGYSGGMMLQTGYLFGGTTKVLNSPTGAIQNIDMCGFSFGLGGAIRFYFGKHLRIGGEGYTSKLFYGKNGTHTSLGWGGILADCKWDFDKLTLFAGGTFGGGKARNFVFENQSSSNAILNKNTAFREYSIMIISPFIGVEYAVTSKLHLIAKVDWIVNITKKQPDFVMGPRLYFGVMFCHLKERK